MIWFRGEREVRGHLNSISAYLQSPNGLKQGEEAIFDEIARLKLLIKISTDICLDKVQG